MCTKTPPLSSNASAAGLQNDGSKLADAWRASKECEALTAMVASPTTGGLNVQVRLE